jgi:hypothetical protein
MTVSTINRDAIIAAAKLLVEPGGITELRALDAKLQGDHRSGTASGYFDSASKLADAAGRIVSAKGLYIIPNAINRDLLARASNRVRLVGKADPLTADHDVERRRWLLIDLDPQRPAGIASKDAEHDAARERAEAVRSHLRGEGWPEPVLADSGNGWHLLYRIDLPADDGGIVQRILTALAARFDDGAVKVDTGVYNPARIWKLYGTMARKGDHTPDRPHRMARLVEVPEPLELVAGSLLIALAGPAASAASKAAPSRKAAGTGEFDLEAWIARNLPNAEGPSDWKGGGLMWTLPTCPFNAEHTGGCAYIGRHPDGAIVAGCHHNSCQHWGWKELRELLEPKASRPAASNAEGDGDGPDDENKPSQAEQLVRLALELCRLGQTPKREPFAVLHSGPNVAGLLRGSGGSLRDILAREYRRRCRRVANATAYADALATLRGEAAEAPAEAAHLRVGPHGDGIVLDLGTLDGAAVVVDATGWRVVARSPILFQRTALSGALPVPERGGNLTTLRELLNVTDDTWPILLGWMVAALLPDLPHPILMLGGQQGAGKTTAARYICGLFDPSDAPTRSQPRDPEAWAMSAANGWATVIDNVSSIPDWWSDALCKAVTGDGWVRRTLYTNGDVSVLSFRRVVAMTSIDAGALRGDLGERLVLVDLEAIPNAKRRTERALDKAYAAARPAMLGALLDLLAAVLARLDTVTLPELPRMADFARVLAALDDAIGTNALALYGDQGKRIAGEVLDADPVGEAVAAFVRSHGEWRGGAGALLKAIRPDDAGRGWPRNGRGLSARLKRLAPALELQGVRVTPPGKTDRTRVYLLQVIAQTAQPPGNGHDAAPRAFDGRAIVHPSNANRPAQHNGHGPTEGDSGRSGDSGGSAQASSNTGDGWGEL